MTKFQKQMLTIAAAGALTAVTALPAMALENEFHGIYNFNAIFQNYAQTSTAGITINEPAATTSRRADQVLEQRVRLQYIAKASNDLKMVTQFEINNAFGGKTSLASGTTTNGSTSPDFAGSDLDTDGINLMTKHAYLDFNATKDINVKVGLQAYKDALAGILIDADVPGVYVNTKVSGVALTIGMARFEDAKIYPDSNNISPSFVGDATTDLYSVDAAYNLNKSTKLGLSVYYLNDTTGATSTTNNKEFVTVGLNGSTQVAGIDVKGFVAMQQGKAATSNEDIKAKAFNLQASTKFAGGVLKAGYLYTTGNDAATTKDEGWQGSGVASYNDSGSMFLIRNTGHNSTSTGSFYQLFDMSNVSLLTLGYSTNVTDKMGASVNVGVRSNNKAGSTNVLDGYVGTEVNGEVSYKLYPNMTVLAQLGYLTLDSSYTGENPYSARAGIRFSF